MQRKMRLVGNCEENMKTAGTLNSSQSTSLTSSTRSSFDSVDPLITLTHSSTAKKPSTSPRWCSTREWTAINRRHSPDSIRLCDFKPIQRVGSGDSGTVYVCQLRDIDTNVAKNRNHHCSEDLDDDSNDVNPLLYAMKVVDKRELAAKKKVERAKVERKVLRSLDHPFLPTLYAEFEASSHYYCVVTEFCSGGDLYSLRYRQPTKRFDFDATRFYVAEVLVALEYLHMLGIIYRDLKPENVLIRSDGHIMLSDFDLSLQSTCSPRIDAPHPPQPPSPPSSSSSSSSSSRCLSWFHSKKNKILKKKKTGNSSSSKPVFVAEPAEARSFSFVGTHEYVAPEVAAGRSHGSAVDWWALGIFIYELFHGRTPFVGSNNELTLRNIVRQRLAFPSTLEVDPRAKDLMTRLLQRDPCRRLGTERGAADVKTHPFFSGVNFAVLRSETPPFVPMQSVVPLLDPKKPSSKSSRFDYF